jgi:ABC-type phosphonate transport system ATPase subunit
MCDETEYDVVMLSEMEQRVVMRSEIGLHHEAAGAV